MKIGDAFVLRNSACRYDIGVDGKNRSFVDLATKKDYCEPGQPFMVVARGTTTWPSSRVELNGDIATVSFGDSGVQVKAKLAVLPSYFTLIVEEVAGGEVDSVQVCNLLLGITENVGTLVNAAWDSQFAACVLACNDLTESFGANSAKAHLCARCYREYGFEGAKFALFGVPQGKLLDTIEKVEIDQGLPHPTINGVWIKRAPERFASYLMAHGVGEKNIDRVLEFARGGFGCIEIYPWRSMPSYELNPGLFPNGMEGLKKVADKIHAAGLQLGLHSMQGMVGWGPKDDPYIVPKADPRLLQDRHATLASVLDAKATEIRVKEGTTGWPDKADLYLEGEIVRYGRRTDTGFAECQRGLHGTTVTSHPEGAKVGNLVNCFPIWGGTVYCPDVNSTMIDEICDRIARVFNETGADMSYFDGGEEVAVQPPWWRNQGRIALGVVKRLKKPVILEGNALYTHLAWHVITRGSPHYDPIYFGRRDYTLRFKGQNPAGHARNLFTGDVGWFNPHVHSLVVDAVTPDEVLLLCLKALGGKSPISFQVDIDNPWANKRMPEMQEIIRACDELKRRDYFADAACAELTRPLVEHTLEQTVDGEWNLRPMQFGPSRTVDVGRREGSGELCEFEWSYRNPHGEQRPWVRIRARTRLAPYGSKENLVLADFTSGLPFKPDGSASADLTQSIEASTEKTPDGGSAFCYRAENHGKAVSNWCQASLRFPQPLDLTHHRRLGLWVRSEGQGGLLNVQLAGTDMRRDHYIDLTFNGWKYLILDPPEDSRFWNYSWPYSFTDLMYTCWGIYNNAKELHLFYNALPGGGKATCVIGRIEALHEDPAPLKNPALTVAGGTLTFPVSMNPDEYLEMSWDGRCRHFDPNGGVMGEVKPAGSLRLSSGDNGVRFSCAEDATTSPRAEITLAARGEPMPNARKKRIPAKGKSKAETKRSVYPSLTAGSTERTETLHLAPNSDGGYRLMQGPFERVDSLPSHSLGAFDGAANVWTVDNDRKVPSRVAVLLSRGASPSTPSVNYDDPKALLLEDFDDLTAYGMSETNQYEKYVVGDGKRLTKDGPVRAGVSQAFTTITEGALAGKSWAVYTAKNDGEAGGWSGIGRRFPKPVDLSKHEAVGFRLQGDGKGESLRFQFRDVTGRYADWVVPIDFTGWKLQVFRLADVKDFDWKKIEYVLFYFNNIPANATCEMKFDDVKAFSKATSAAWLRKPVLSINGKTATIPVDLGAGETVLIDDSGRGSLWKSGKRRGKTWKVAGEALLLTPGTNRLELSCDVSMGTPRDVSVRVFRIGELQ
ncbi:MAG: hypothetical protein HY318_05490 [Armatimonadetes bacterium]|nr:hypothetical protein [Armatimonadota bacterium]